MKHSSFVSCSARVAMCVLAATLGACISGDVVEVSGPGIPIDTSGGSPTIQRGTITVAVSIDPADAATAAAVGLGVGGLTVTLASQGTNAAPKTAVTNATGTAQFTGLLEGQYVASVSRPLTPAEVALLPPADRDASLFAGGRSTRLTPGQSATLSFAILAARRGSLVISEIHSYNAPPIAYPYSNYVEVYNNGDTTAYLDGLYLAYTGVNGYHTDSRYSCATSSRIRNDNERIWLFQIWAFPGGGRDFPVPPGEGRVIAMDAINHTVASAQTTHQDLSGAHFEQYMSTVDTDNPGAADMLRVRVDGTGALGRGYTNNSARSLVLLTPTPASQWAADTIQHEYSPVPGEAPGSSIYVGLPASSVLDVFSWISDPTYRATFGLPMECEPWIGPVFDRGVSTIFSSTEPLALRRASLGLNEAGRETLQRTRNSDRDLEYGPPLRRSLRRGQ